MFAGKRCLSVGEVTGFPYGTLAFIGYICQVGLEADSTLVARSTRCSQLIQS